MCSSDLKVGVPNLKINCAARLDFDCDDTTASDRNHLYFACGGEETLISLFVYHKPGFIVGASPQPQLRLLSELDGHHSGIRALHYTGSGSGSGNTGFLLSGGGRSQLIAWRLCVTELTQELRHERLQMLTLVGEDSSKERMDVRVMDIQSQIRSQASEG